jgi:hypothetical protein
MLKIFEIIFEARNLGIEFNDLGFQPGVHPTITTKNKLLDGIKRQVISILKGENKYLPNYGRTLTQNELAQLIKKGFIELPDKNGEMQEISIHQAIDKPGMLIDILKELVESGVYSQSDVRPSLGYLIASIGVMKMKKLQKENFSKLSNKEIEFLLLFI